MLEPFRRFETAVRQQAVVADRHADLTEDDYAKEERNDARPAEQPGQNRQQRQKVQDDKRRYVRDLNCPRVNTFGKCKGRLGRKQRLPLRVTKSRGGASPKE